ncbi:Iron hydrogenase [Mycena kentingensis (nom. inval.)]|nr:Iron hydrogenase [Mycena kentingensis (nom. inval.)]
MFLLPAAILAAASTLDLVYAVTPEDLAATYGLTTSTILPFPAATQAAAESQALLASQWGLSRGRIQNGGADLAFVDDPFPNNPAPGSTTNTSGPVLQITYPAGSFSGDTGGAQFYNLWNASDGNFQSMMLRYEVAFDENFDWRKGGKLPGKFCARFSSNAADGTSCFSARLMWRPNGAGEAYTYTPTPNNICSDTKVECSSDAFGTSLSRGSFTFHSGEWNHVVMLIQLNNPVDTANGNLEVYFNNVKALQQSDMQIRATSNLTINGMYFSTFFGGADDSWATPNTVHTYFRNIELWAGSNPSNLTGAHTLADLNDFISPSQACIKPVEQLDKPIEKLPGEAATAIHVDSGGSYYEVASGSGKKLEPAQISLNDCLAGCITSAESVLITLQSHTEVLSFLDSNALLPPSSRKTPVISIAPQSLASLATAITSRSGVPTTPRQILRRVRHFCESELGFAHTFDTTFARHVAHAEHLKEFEERRADAGTPGKLPMLASACPGWICYAEKAHSEMLPFISTTKSPQQIMGTLVKNWMGQLWNLLPNQVYHVSVMPCYDKKLEASRSDFYNELYATRDVDCVITTGELELIMQEKGWDLTIPVEGELDLPPSLDWSTKPHSISFSTLPELMTHPGSSSGSYLQSIISHLMATSGSSLSLSVKTMRNSDYEEYTLCRDSDQVPVFKGAKCYGFRNLQNVVRKVGRERGVQVGSGAAGRLAGRSSARRTKRSEEGQADRNYDYIEVMACPGGCVNGGGQLKPLSRSDDAEGYARDWEEQGVLANAKWGDKEWTKKVEESYWAVEAARYEADRLLQWALDDLCPTDEGVGDVDDGGQTIFRTSYRAVESDIVGLSVKW